MNTSHNIPEYIPGHFQVTLGEFEDVSDDMYTTRKLERTIGWVIIEGTQIDVIITNIIVW